MSWKKKEKELTEEEAIEQAKEQLRPYWYNSSPLVAPIQSEEGVGLYPLSPSFSSDPRLLLFFDPTTYTGVRVTEVCAELYTRYAQYGVSFLMVLEPKFDFMLSREWLEHYANSLKTKAEICIDFKSGLEKAFEIKSKPSFIFLSRDGVLLHHESLENLDLVESTIQQYLRTSDPGLPLRPLVQSSAFFANDRSFVDFGSKFDFEIKTRPFSREAPDLRVEEGILFEGEWIQDPDYVYTRDPEAKIHFRSDYPNIAILARPFSRTADKARVFVEINGSPAFGALVTKSVHTDDQGQVYFELDFASLKRILKDLPETERMITLRFASSLRVPGAVYGIRFSSS